MKKIVLIMILAMAVLFSSCDETSTAQKMYGGTGADSAQSIQQTSDGGYIVAGLSTSVDVSGVTNHGGMDAYIIKFDSKGNIVWQNMYGGSDSDMAFSIQQTRDGGYIVAGYSCSTDISGLTSNGYKDIYVIKLDSNGNVVWQKMYGGSHDDVAHSIQQTTDGGYIVAGYSESKDIPGLTNHGGDCESGCLRDIYIIKLDGNGNVVWQKMYGSSQDDEAKSIQQTSDGGYIVAGYSSAPDIPGVTNHGLLDAYILKLDGNGNVVWQKLYGGSGNDIAYSIQKTSDGGYIMAGESDSTDITGVTNNGTSDAFVIKLDSNGNAEWQKMYGGTANDRAYSIQQTSDSGYVFAGESDSTNMTGVTNHGGSDAYIVKLDSSGIVSWQKMYGGSKTAYYCWEVGFFPVGMECGSHRGDDPAYSIQQTSDGQYIVAGSSNSADISGASHHGSNGLLDSYILKLDSSGNL